MDFTEKSVPLTRVDSVVIFPLPGINGGEKLTLSYYLLLKSVCSHEAGSGENSTVTCKEAKAGLENFLGHWQLSFIQKATYWVCPHANVPAVGEDGGKVEASSAPQPPCCRKGITDVGTGGSCLPILLAGEKLLQMASASRGANSKNRGIHDRNCWEKKKRKRKALLI